MPAPTRGLCALALFGLGGAAVATDLPPQTTTLAPISVHASDTQVMDTPAVSVRVDRAHLQQQNVTGSADALKFAPNLQVRQRYIGDPNAVISGRNAAPCRARAAWSMPTACCCPT